MNSYFHLICAYFGLQTGYTKETLMDMEADFYLVHSDEEYIEENYLRHFVITYLYISRINNTFPFFSKKGFLTKFLFSPYIESVGQSVV